MSDLIQTAQPTGRPHMWITYYDGDTPCDPAGDVAYFNCLAFAGCGIRLYEMTRNREDLQQRVLPYLRIICTHLVREVFKRNAKGAWELSGIVAGDVGAPEVDANGQMDILLWSVMTLAKFAEYASLAGETSEITSASGEIAAYFREHRIALRVSDNWYPWLPYLAPAFPFADFSAFWDDSDGVMRRFLIGPADFETVMHASGGLGSLRPKPMVGTYSGMAWFNFCNAAALTLTGHRDLALEFQDGGLKYTSGLGYFTESPYELQAGGNSPYVPSCGSYLSSILGMFASSTLWDDEVRVGMDMPRFWQYQRVWWKNIRTFQGASVSAVYDPLHVEVTVEQERAHPVQVRVPARIAGEPLCITLDGVRLDAPYDVATESVRFILPAGRHAVSIVRDLEQVADITVIEPFDHGAQLCDLLRKPGRTVRWLRDVDGLAAVAPHSRAFLHHLSFVALPLNNVRQLEDAVREGATLITMFHAAISHYCAPMAALTGLNGKVSDVWCFDGKLATLTMTEAGRAALPGLPESLTMHVSVKDFVLDPGPDVEILARLEDSGMPAITRRRLGKGWVWWLAAGNKIMDRPLALGWGLHLSRDVFVFGKTREMYAQRPWLDDPDFAKALEAIVTHRTSKEQSR